MRRSDTKEREKTETLQQKHARLRRRLKDFSYAGCDPRDPHRKKVEAAVERVERKMEQGKES